MCGIAGIFSYRNSAPPVDQQELIAIRDHMAARGPDGTGLWISPDKRIGFAHRRLSIIDLSTGGDQPMFTPDRGLSIVFNGEIYNYQALRKQLEAKGHVFRSSSDTEVLLYAYVEYGESMVDHLRGMYTIAIWSEKDRSLFLARDPFGIKPLYYSDTGNQFHFASQVKALKQCQRIDLSPCPAGHTGFFLWGSVPEPFTLFEGIRALAPGHTLKLELGKSPKINQFFSIASLYERAERANYQSLSEVQRLEWLGDIVSDTVKHHLVSDVPVGVFLSAGIDSTALAAHAAHLSNQRVQTVTLGFEEFRGTLQDETVLAKKAAEAIGADHSTIWVKRKDFVEDLEHLLVSMDQPSCDGVNSYFISKAAKQAGLKVVLSGLGGDELLGSYPSFHDIPLSVATLNKLPFRREIARPFRHLITGAAGIFTSPKYAGLLEYGATYEGAYLLRRGVFMPWEMHKVLSPDLFKKGLADLTVSQSLQSSIGKIRSPYLRVSALEMNWYMLNQLLRDADWASMAHSVEVRLPFIDPVFIEALAPTLANADRPTKNDLSRSTPIPLPEEIHVREKTGFSVPVREWLQSAKPGMGRRRGLRGWCEFVYRTASNNKRAVALVTDGFGGRGGIAKFNRDLLSSCVGHPSFTKTVAFPRVQVEQFNVAELPKTLAWRSSAAQGKIKFIREVLGVIFSRNPINLIYCGHINLLPLASIAKLRHRCPIVLIIHGIDAWTPPSGVLARHLISDVDIVLAVSGVTKERFALWSSVDRERILILPNCVDVHEFTPRPRNVLLGQKYGLGEGRHILTLGRLAGKERYKGFDEVLEVMPSLLRKIPNLKYVISGDGSDMARLKAKALRLGIESNVVFTGYVPEEDKIDLYNLCDAYVMPSRGEGFGIVFLEAMACGLPALGSTLDGSREALRDGELGILVNPDDSAALETGILNCLKASKPSPESLAYFSYENFDKRLHAHIDRIVTLDIRPDPTI